MAASESHREDLLREATALVERAELTVPGEIEPVIIGFRRDGSASFYFGADPVYQFNIVGELRRAYIDGLLYKAERGRLIALSRERSDSEVALVRHELKTDQMTALLNVLAANLTDLRSALVAGAFELVGQIPHDCSVVARIKDWLDAFKSPPPIANRPNVR